MVAASSSPPEGHTARDHYPDQPRRGREQEFRLTWPTSSAPTRSSPDPGSGSGREPCSSTPTPSSQPVPADGSPKCRRTGRRSSSTSPPDHPAGLINAHVHLAFNGRPDRIEELMNCHDDSDPDPGKDCRARTHGTARPKGTAAQAGSRVVSAMLDVLADRSVKPSKCRTG